MPMRKSRAQSLVRFQPSPNRVLIQVNEDILNDRVSKIIIPQAHRNKGYALIGRVVGLGEFPEEHATISRGGNVAVTDRWQLEIGDAIFFHVHESFEIRLDGVDYYVIDEDAVLGKIDLDN